MKRHGSRGDRSGSDGGGRLAPFLVVLAIGVCGAVLIRPGSGPAAEQTPLLQAEVRLAHYGIPEAGAVRRGQLQVAWTDDGPRLTVPRLGDAPAPTLPRAVRSEAPPLGTGGCFTLDDASIAGHNALGGRFGAYAIGESSASAELGVDPSGRRVLTFECERGGGPSSPCGMWIQLFDPEQPVRTFVDTSGLSDLSMWINLEPDAAGILVKAADAEWSRREDAVAVGSISRFRDGSAEGGWSRVRIPLSSFPSQLALDSLAMVVLEATEPGTTEVLLSGTQFCGSGGQPFEAPPPPPGPPLPDDSERALWVWDTRELLSSDRARSRFLSFIESSGFDRVFLQLVPARGRQARRGFVPFDRDATAELVGALGALGVQSYAMDGDPAYALPENHDGVVRTVEAVAQYNASVRPEQRFFGVHYDIEPYLLDGFQGPRRPVILDGFLEVVERMSVVTDEAGLAFGLAVPFWLDTVDRFTGEPLATEFGDSAGLVLHHLMSMIDELAVMDYRTEAEGLNGSVALILGELDAARDAGVEVWAGVETVELPDADLFEFGGEAREGLPPANGGTWIVAEPLDDGEVRWWLVPPGAEEELRDEVGASTDGVRHWAAGPPVRVPADLQTYHRLGVDRMRDEVGQMVEAIGSHPAFLGIAYHHYGSLEAMDWRSLW